MDRLAAQGWLDRYVAAWLSYERDDIAALFRGACRIRYHPMQAEWEGQFAGQQIRTEES